MKYLKYILKFFLSKDGGKLRFITLLPLVGLSLGSFIIFITYSIMNSLEIGIKSKIDAISYNYIVSTNDNQNCIIDNKGFEKVVILSNNQIEYPVKLRYFSNNHILDKINPYLINKGNESRAIIGDNLADELSTSLYDTLTVLLPSDINIISNSVPSFEVEIDNIYNIDILDYDKNNIILIGEDFLNYFRYLNNIEYYSDEECLSDNSYHKEENDLIVAAISFEKNIYTGLGFFVIFVSCVMMFNIMTMTMVDKEQQIWILNVIGLSKGNILKIILIKNIFSSLIFSLSGYILSEILLLLNFHFNYFKYIFNLFPVKIMPMSIELHNVIIMLLAVNFLAVISSSSPYYILNRKM